MTDPVKLLSDDEVAEVAAMFPYAEYQPTRSPDEVDPCEFCKGTIDDHKANCVVPHVHALCQTVRALREQLAQSQAGYQRATIGLSNLYHVITNERCDDAVALGMATSAVGSLIRLRDELKDQLAQVTQERDGYREQLLKAVETEVEI